MGRKVSKTKHANHKLNSKVDKTIYGYNYARHTLGYDNYKNSFDYYSPGYYSLYDPY